MSDIKGLAERLRDYSAIRTIVDCKPGYISATENLLREAASALTAAEARRKHVEERWYASNREIARLDERVKAAEAILRPLYKCDPAVRVWFGDPAFTGRRAGHMGDINGPGCDPDTP